jgi:hypothetical protein
MPGKFAAKDAMDLSQGKLIYGDNEILTMDTKILLKQFTLTV